ncbi:F-box protein At2g21930-like [Castanea sativa]|uniref:F-box protein At2g21930-like n=1 Tax=Castanea sativa TaxID=21020 RepID=UPI003F64ACE5
MQHLSDLSNYLPLEVIEEILVRLSAKSLLRFRSVCKKWYSLISNSRFATTHLDRNNQRPSLYFLFGRGYDRKQRLTLHSNPAIDSSDFIEFHCPYEHGWTNFKIVSSVNGLICLVNNTKFILWNPSINRSVQLPNLHSRRYIYCHGFGYHAPTKEYKAVRITYLEVHEPVAEIYNYTLNNGECHLFTLSSSAHFFVQHETVSVSMNGALHWLAATKSQNPEQHAYHNFILSFNLGDENVFHEVLVSKA